MEHAHIPPSDVITVEFNDHVAIVWLDRPAQRNAFAGEFWADLPKIMEALDGDNNTRVIVIAARGQSFTPSLADGCRVSGVPALLDRVVDNLLGNAIKYSVDGDKIEVVVRADGERIVFSVCDHGPGIPADEIPRLSERFYRIAGAAESGSGLGLALVDEIATWHGGCIYIDS